MCCRFASAVVVIPVDNGRNAATHNAMEELGDHQPFSPISFSWRPVPDVDPSLDRVTPEDNSVPMPRVIPACPTDMVVVTTTTMSMSTTVVAAKELLGSDTLFWPFVDVPFFLLLLVPSDVGPMPPVTLTLISSIDRSTRDCREEF